MSKNQAMAHSQPPSGIFMGTYGSHQVRSWPLKSKRAFLT